MEGFLFLCVLGLAAWLIAAQTRLSALRDRVDRMADYLNRKIAEERTAGFKEPPAAPPPEPVDPHARWRNPPRDPQPEPEPEPEPVAFAAEEPQPVIRAAPEGPFIEPDPPRRYTPPKHEREPARPREKSPVYTWLAENGLAWLGGGALALGGLFLVVYAAQRGLFTPAMRLGAAAVLGAGMIGAGEWVRRQVDVPGGRNLLVSGLLAGAGAATLYGDVWAAHVLYHYIPFGLAAGLVAAISLGLLAYALVQGEGLAILAMFGALVAPAVIGLGAWDRNTLDAYLAVVLAAGFACAGLRRWGRTGLITLIGLAPWILLALVDHPGRSVLLILAGPLAAAGAGLWARRKPDPEAKSGLFDLMPGLALAFASLMSLGLWLTTVFDRQPLPPVGLLAMGLSLSAGLMAAGKLVKPLHFAAPTVAAIFGSLIAFHAGDFKLAGPDTVLWLVMMSAAMAASGFGAALFNREDRTPLLALGGLGTALFATLSWTALPSGDLHTRWMLPGALAALMAAGAVFLARTSDDCRTDNGLALWIAATAELTFIALYAVVDLTWMPAATAALAIALSALALRPGWKGFAQSAIAGGLATLAVMARPGFVQAASGGTMPIWALAASAGLAALLVFGGGLIMRRDPAARREAEAMETAALLVALLGAFLLLNRLLAGADPQVAGMLMMSSLRSLILLAAGLLLAIRAREDDSALVRFRLLAVLGAGVAHAVLMQVFAFNPWWGFGENPVGVIGLNSLLVSYLAPGVMLAVMAKRGLPGAPAWTRLAAVGGFLFGLLWAVLALRHAWHPRMQIGDVYQAEACAYAVLLLAAAAGLVLLRRRQSSSTGWLAACAWPSAGVTLALSAIVLWLLANPWWGPAPERLGPVEAVMVLLFFSAAAGLSILIFRQAGPDARDGEGQPMLARAALIAGAGHLFVLLNLSVRWAFHGGDLAERGGSSLETWTFSAAWALYGLGALLVGAARRNYSLRWIGLGALLLSLLKVLVFDTATLDGVARAASFLAVGALLLVAALAARRLNARALLFAPKEDAP